MSHKDAACVRSHFEAIEVRVGMTTGARIHARVGGLAAKDIKGEDGQR